MFDFKHACTGLAIVSITVMSACSGSGVFQPTSTTSGAQQTNENAGGSRLERSHSTKGYTVTDLGTLGGTFSYPSGGLNNRAIVAGVSTLAGDTVHHSFIWENGRKMDLGTLPAGPNSDSDGIDERLQITGAADGAASTADCAGSRFSSSALDSHAYLWQSGIMRDLGTLGGKSSKGNWINNRGQIVGISQIKAIDPNPSELVGCPAGSEIRRAFLYENGKMRDIGTLGGFDSAATSINDGGQIVGVSTLSKTIDPQFGFVVEHAFLKTNGIMNDLGTLGGGLSVALALNNKSAVVGVSTLPREQHVHPFFWQRGAIADLGTIDGDTDANAYGINSVGQVVGDSDTSTTMRAFVWQNGVMTDLNTLIGPNSGFQIASGISINDAGQIAALALVERTGEMHAVILSPADNSMRANGRPVYLTPRLRKLLSKRFRSPLMRF